MSHTENILKMLPDRINQRNDLMVTPPWIAKDMINLLPEEVWNKNSTFLDPACKSGIFLHEIYLKLMETPAMIQEFPDNAERRKHILQNQLYGIALNPMCQLMSARTVYGTIQGENNIILIDNYINIIKNKDTKFFKEAIKEQFGEMKFNVVIGNPPYQSKTKAIYNEFIDAAINLESEAIAMIVKNNWLVSDTLKETRKNMIKNGLTDIINYPIISDIFSNASTAVSIFAIQRGEKRKTHLKEIKKGVVTSDFYADLTNSAIISLSEVEQSIINKFSSISAVNNFGKVTYPSEPFRITTNGKVGRGESAYDLENYDKKTDRNNIAVVYMDTNKEPYAMYTSLSKVPSRVELVPMYKVICGRILTKDSKVVNNIRLLEPNTVCTSSWGLLFASDKKEEAVNVVKYVKTKLFRYLLQILGEDGVIALSAYRFSLIPLQDFTNGSDIDWSQSVENIDQQLYKKYNLTEEEIAYIEKTIKPMQ